MTANADLLPLENRLLRRNAARAAILEAGRGLAARDGVAEVSLSAVAAQAGFGPSTVFGHFRNKDELLLAILADDLAALAALMRAETKATETFVPPEYVRVPSPEQAAAQTDAETPNQGDAAQLESQADATSADALGSQGLDLNAANAADSIQENAPQRPRVDAWLERRLRVFERTLTDVERRLKEAEANTTKSLSLSEHGMKSLFERMEAFERQQGDVAQSLTLRMEETERRQRGATAEMRAVMNDTATRIEILESKLRSDQERAFGRRASEVREQTAAADSQSERNEPQNDTTYTAAVQRAASAATALAEMEQQAAPKRAPRRSLAGRRIRLEGKHVAMAACVVVIALALAAFAAFYVGVARGHDLAAAARLASQKTAKPIHSASMGAGPAHMQAAAAPDPRARLATLAQAGNAKAQLLLGLRYLHGDGLPPDRRMAAEWIRRAADQHDPLAQYWLGTLYDRGDGVAADSAEAVRWYEAAAGQGNRKAMHALGVAYAQGSGTQKDYSAAARWFSKAAGLGLMNSQFNLGVLYERGLGVPQSLLDAYKWYAIAAAQGDGESRARIEALKTQLTADDLAAAEGAAGTFHPQPIDAEANNVPALAGLSPAVRR